MIIYRCFPWDREVKPAVRGGALWFPRMLQGEGRHDNPELYGCLYVTAEPISSVVERLQVFRNRPTLESWMLELFGLPLALAEIELDDAAELVDLDDPRVLVREQLRPSLVATGDRERTQSDAAELFERHPDAVGFRWWSTFESQWTNVTLLDRAAVSISVGDVRELGVDDSAVLEAARFLGLRG